MIVVSDSSPIICLCAIDQSQLLPAIYGEVIIPEAVADELLAGGPGAPGFEALNEPWLRVVPVSDKSMVASFLELDIGEAEAPPLAKEKNADVLLVDERAARRTAVQHGISVVGLLGVLLAAKSRGLLRRIAPVVKDLQVRAGYWVSEELVFNTLKIAGEAGEPK